MDTTDRLWLVAKKERASQTNTSQNHFKIFLNEMEKQGLNLDKVKVGKSEVMLWGLETYGNISKKHKQRKERASGAVHRLAEKLHISETHDENKAPST